MAEVDEAIKLKLQLLGNSTPLTVQRKDTISEVIKMFKQVVPVESDHIVELFYNTTRLQDVRTIRQCGLNEGDSLTVVVRERPMHNSFASSIEALDLEPMRPAQPMHAQHLPQKQVELQTAAAANPAETIALNLLQVSGNSTPLTVQRKDTISEVIKMFKQVVPVESDHIVELFCNTTRLQDVRTIRQCGLNEGDSLTVVVRKRPMQNSFASMIKGLDLQPIRARNQPR